MFGKIDPKQIAGMMKKMGIAQVELDAKRVIIELENSQIIIDEPSVSKINMQGQESFQISGKSREESLQKFSDDDVKMVMEKTQKSRDQVINFLEKNNGDIALAIIELR